ncbi:hypothetical protein ACWX0O_01845 [Nitrobacteraceae bacterium UC4449_H16]
MLKLAFSWLTGGGFKMLTDMYAKGKDSAVESERIQAAWAKSQLDAMAANRGATSGFLEMRVITFIIAGVYTLHLVLVGLDTMFGWTWNGSPVNAFPPPFNEWEGSILLSFFGLTAGVIGIKAIAGAFRR